MEVTDENGTAIISDIVETDDVSGYSSATFLSRHLNEIIQISDVQGFSGKGAVNINESISFPDAVNNGSIILPRIYSEKIDLLSVNGTYTNSTIALNGTGFVVVEDTISSDINTMSISSWIKPEFHVGNPQYTIASKDNSFNETLNLLFSSNENSKFPNGSNE